jgi:hypothetical protein
MRLKAITQLQNKIGSLEAPPKIHRGYSFARWLVTALYVLMFIGSISSAASGPYGEGLGAAFAALAVTVIYTLLMLLLWLHERFPPTRG